MLDIKFVRDNPDAVKENIKKKFQDAKLPLVDEVIEKDAKYRECLKEVESLKAARNKLSKANGPLFGQLKKCTDEAQKAELQKQINKKLEAAGLPKDMVKAQIGGVNTGVVGANDNDALCLKINDNTALPDSGQYIIDGVRGSAAFNIFYQTDGRMIPAYTTGAKDITD